MEKMPYQEAAMANTTTMTLPQAPVVTSDWRQALPVMTSATITLRELRASDAPSLLAMLSTEEVARFISPPPTTVEGFERFIAWTQRERAAGNYICFGIVPHGMEHAIGLFQVRQLEPGFGTAEWGFAIGSEFWGTGIFVEGARMVVNFAFDTVHVHRLEARAAVKNGRGNGALRKLGAVQEGVLRKSFLRNGEYLDQVLWTILEGEWSEPQPRRKVVVN
jgi:RimJ/RimL family protein N-acetyltransferase